MSVAFRRESDEEHLEPKFEIPLPAGPNLVTPRGLAMIEARVEELEAADPTDVQRDLRYWRTRLATAQVMPPATGDAVAFGTRVTFRLDGGTKRTISIVGDDEADPAAGLLAFTAPLANAMLGAEPGETVDFGDREIELVKVEPIDQPTASS